MIKNIARILSLIALGLFGSVIITFVILFLLPTHPDNEQHTQIMLYVGIPLTGDISFLTSSEYSHMRDVKVLFWTMCIFFLLAGIPYIWKFEKYNAQHYLYAIAGIGSILILGALMASSGFSGFWEFFHRIFFPQGNWQFPFKSTLITLYPESYFLGASTIFFGVCCIVLSVFMRQFNKLKR